jgi:hypothetical protein
MAQRRVSQCLAVGTLGACAGELDDAEGRFPVRLRACPVPKSCFASSIATSMAHLAACLSINGMGSKAVRQLHDALTAEGLAFAARTEPRSGIPNCPATCARGLAPAFALWPAPGPRQGSCQVDVASGGGSVCW